MDCLIYIVMIGVKYVFMQQVGIVNNLVNVSIVGFKVQEYCFCVVLVVGEGMLMCVFVVDVLVSDVMDEGLLMFIG